MPSSTIALSAFFLVATTAVWIADSPQEREGGQEPTQTQDGRTTSEGRPFPSAPDSISGSDGMLPNLDEVGNGLGLFVRQPGADEFEFVPWKSEKTFNRITFLARKKPGLHIHFAPGEYVVESRLDLHFNPDARISGTPRSRLVFAEGPNMVGFNTAPIEEGAVSIEVSHPELFKPHARYQAYRANGTSDRQVEIVVNTVDVENMRLILSQPVKYLPHVRKTGLPAGLQLMEELNFFHVLSSPRLVIENLEMDGRDRGGIRGHTIYSGVYASGMHHGEGRPSIEGLTVRGCTFKNLKGRGVAFYGIAGGLIENNEFEHIRAQAIEIDHISSGIVRNNYVNGAEVGAMINDAFESIVEGNAFVNCEKGARFLKVYPVDWVNQGNIVRHNRIGPGCIIGIEFGNEGPTNNIVKNNTFIGLSDEARIHGGKGNTIQD